MNWREYGSEFSKLMIFSSVTSKSVFWFLESNFHSRPLKNQPKPSLKDYEIIEII